MKERFFHGRLSACSRNIYERLPHSYVYWYQSKVYPFRSIEERMSDCHSSSSSSSCLSLSQWMTRRERCQTALNDENTRLSPLFLIERISVRWSDWLIDFKDNLPHVQSTSNRLVIKYRWMTLFNSHDVKVFSEADRWIIKSNGSQRRRQSETFISHPSNQERNRNYFHNRRIRSFA